MKPIGTHNYFVYITTNKNKTTLYIGVTNNLSYRLGDYNFKILPTGSSVRLDFGDLI